jgi:hypothetical protein
MSQNDDKQGRKRLNDAKIDENALQFEFSGSEGGPDTQTPSDWRRLEFRWQNGGCLATETEETRVREMLDREYRETGTIKTTGDGTTMGDLVAFHRFVMRLRAERERQGLSLADMAELAKIDKAALSRLDVNARHRLHRAVRSLH